MHSVKKGGGANVTFLDKMMMMMIFNARSISFQVFVMAPLLEFQMVVRDKPLFTCINFSVNNW